MKTRAGDPYHACQSDCPHDLAPGVLVSELLRGDGPHPSTGVVTTLRIRRPSAGPAIALRRAS